MLYTRESILPAEEEGKEEEEESARAVGSHERILPVLEKEILRTPVVTKGDICQKSLQRHLGSFQIQKF